MTTAKKKPAPKTVETVPSFNIREMAFDLLKGLGKDTKKKDFLAELHKKHTGVVAGSDSTLSNYYNRGRGEFGWTKKRTGGKVKTRTVQGGGGVVPTSNGKPSLLDAAAAIATLKAAGLIN